MSVSKPHTKLGKQIKGIIADLQTKFVRDVFADMRYFHTDQRREENKAFESMWKDRMNYNELAEQPPEYLEPVPPEDEHLYMDAPSMFDKLPARISQRPPPTGGGDGLGSYGPHRIVLRDDDE
mmetsp:Transcript_7841/g.26676  ORF Transcript_7841/g.26676 Transcript_7841/m.26676 type:complete len:123 (-) Transcript_7841:36-404(-)